MKTNLIIAGSLVAILLLCFVFLLGDDTGDRVDEIEVLCAAGLRKPIEEIAQKYESEYGVKVRLNYGGSGQLLAKIELSGGDLYIPADASYIEKGKEEALMGESFVLSRLTACLIVEEGNPKNIHSLSDLARNDVRVVLAERSAAIGKLTHEVLEEVELLESIEKGIVSKVGTVNEVALQVKLGSSDVGIVWDSLSEQFSDLEFVRVPELSKHRKLAAVGVLKKSKNIEEAEKFARYITQSEVSALILKKYGLTSKLDSKTERSVSE